MHNTVASYRRKQAVLFTMCFIVSSILYVYDCAAAAAPIHTVAEQSDSGNTFSVGFSDRLFVGVNEDDAKIVLKIWAENFAKDCAVKTNPNPVILSGISAIASALANGTVDSVTITTPEYLLLPEKMQKGTLMLPVMNGVSTEQFILLVRNDSSDTTVRDLQNKPLAILTHPGASLGSIWLETLLLEDGIVGLTPFFSQLKQSTKPSHVILSLFFNQVAAALVTQSAFDIAVELNPQISKTLRIIASSSPMVHDVFLFRPDYPTRNRKIIIDKISSMEESTVGHQLRSVFKVSRVVVAPPSCMESARNLMERHSQLINSSSGITSTQ
ncbi:MAG: hypothetical protein EOL87_03620 [Spartobacteria bacterium]|nr:hypothetical protein [Spartobacteria bacterium]